MLKPDIAFGRIRHLRLPLMAKMLLLLVPVAVVPLIVVGTVNIHLGVDAVGLNAITASEFDLSADTARARGFSGYMLKPLDLDLLGKKLADLALPVRKESPL